jgi:hypothetical protein
VIADLVIDAGHRQIGFRLPIERQIEIAGKICHRDPSSSSTMWLSE